MQSLSEFGSVSLGTFHQRYKIYIRYIDCLGSLWLCAEHARLETEKKIKGGVMFSVGRGGFFGVSLRLYSLPYPLAPFPRCPAPCVLPFGSSSPAEPSPAPVIPSERERERVAPAPLLTPVNIGQGLRASYLESLLITKILAYNLEIDKSCTYIAPSLNKTPIQ